MSEALFERYKDALRRGHVAALRGRLDAAVLAYGEAAEIAPERSLPHASLGAVLHRLGRIDEALAAYTAALDRAPQDEAALAGRAEVLAAAGRRVDAADALDRLAEVQQAAGRPDDAAATLRRALALAESRLRRRNLHALVRETGGGAGGDGAAASDEELPTLGPPGVVLVAEAEALLDAGDRPAARDRLLAGASAFRREGHFHAALDACYLALAIAPDDPDLHLALAELYLERGWTDPAVEKLLLLARLADLDENRSVRDRLCALVRRALPDEPSLRAVCA